MKPTLQHGRTQRCKIQSTIRNRLLLKHAIATVQIHPSILWLTGFGKNIINKKLVCPGPLLSPTKINQRCSLTGSPRAVWESFGLARQTLRSKAVLGSLRGLRRRVW